MLSRKQRVKYEQVQFEGEDDMLEKRFELGVGEFSGTKLDEAQREVVFTKVRSCLARPVLNVKVQAPVGEFGILANYIDTFCLDPESLHGITAHILNHVYRSKALIQANDQSECPPRDQGYSPATVLVLLPSKEKAKGFIDKVVEIHCKGLKKKVTGSSRRKLKEVFAEDSDTFKLGLCLGEKRQLSLFTPFINSDLILGSPMSFKQLLAEEDTSFLSSIEVAVVLHGEIILMQNWDHVEDVLSSCNQLPKRDSIVTDINRVRECFLDGCSAQCRQLVIQSEFVSPTLLSFFNRNPNTQGKARYVYHYKSQVPTGVLQKFRKVQTLNMEESVDKRFEYFTTVFWPSIKDSLKAPTLIFASSYFEYLRLKAHFEQNDPDVQGICEYSSKPSRQRQLAHLRSNSVKALCITERLIYYQKARFPDIGDLIFYSLPEHSYIYTELASAAGECNALFTKFDAFALQRIVGDKWTSHIIKSHNDLFSLN